LATSYDRYSHLAITVEDRIAVVRLNRPQALNAINAELHAELETIWGELDADESVGAIILTGEGRAFSSGGDVKRMASRAGTDAGLRYALNVPAATRRLFNSLLEVRQPIVAAINGDVTGLGATIALCCDVTMIAEDARIGDTHVRAGLVAGDGGAVIWPLLIGPNRAKEYLMTGHLLRGSEARDIGLVNHCYPAEILMDKAREFARGILEQPVWAVQWTKLSINKLLRQNINLVLDASLGYEVATLFTYDHKEAATAFAEKRKPQFRGY
jgi:enoyl-CoA hydratase/carnithine racemase